MNQTEEPRLTHHAMLAAWGQYAQAIGVIDAIEAIQLHQKTMVAPQSAVDNSTIARE